MLAHSTSGRAGPRILGAAAIAAALAIFVAASAQAALIVPAGLQAGDTYQLVFVTSTETAATSGDIADYDAFVQAAAAAAGMSSITWRVIGSTLGVDANAHALVSAPVYNMNGELVATGYADFWDGTHLSAMRYTELNLIRTGNNNVWTGTLLNGMSGGVGDALGEATPWWGEMGLLTGWTQHGGNTNTVLYALYALSDPITVPEPGAAWLLAGAAAACAARRLSARARR
jgi:hypothetical protein